MDMLQEIAIHTGLNVNDVRQIVATAPKRYKTYTIPKRHGGRRLIAQPSRELKLVQRFILARYLSELPIHAAAAAYVTGRNIFDNADWHKRNSVILKLDFENFFPSLRVADFRAYVRRIKPEWETDLAFLVNILFYGEGKYTPKSLSIGAPTSPFVSNILMYQLDTLFTQQANELKVTYTRYADDITISGSTLNAVQGMEVRIREALKKTRSPKLKINEKKRGIYTKGQRRMVTGLILTPEGKVSIGRARKREISSLVHKFSLNHLSTDEIGYLKGMLGFGLDNEPTFVESLRTKYGQKLIDDILKLHIPHRTRPILNLANR